MSQSTQPATDAPSTSFKTLAFTPARFTRRARVNPAVFTTETITPTIVTVSQPATSSDPLVVQVYDSSGLTFYQVTCKDRPDGKRLVVYYPVDGFDHPFNGKSTLTGSGTVADPYIFTIYRRGRWPTGLALDVCVEAVDLAGNEING